MRPLWDKMLEQEFGRLRSARVASTCSGLNKSFKVQMLAISGTYIILSLPRSQRVLCNNHHLLLHLGTCSGGHGVFMCYVLWMTSSSACKYTPDESGQHQVRARPRRSNIVSPLHLHTTIYRTTAHSQTHIHKPFTPC